MTTKHAPRRRKTLYTHRMIDDVNEFILEDVEHEEEIVAATRESHATAYQAWNATQLR